MGSVFTVPAIFKAVDRMSATVKRMQKSVKQFGMNTVANMQRASMAFSKLNNRVRRVGQNIKKSLGNIGLAFGMFALVSVVGNAINVFADFEQANAGLAAVMNKTVQENVRLTEDAKRLGATTAKTATEVVGLQESFARLGFAEKSILNMTQSTISGSIAMKGELSETAELVGAMVKSFDAFESVDAPMIIDQMTLATQKSALNFEKLQTGLPIVAGAANAAGIPFTKLMALMGKLSDAGIDASSSSTALRNIFIESAARGDSYQQILQNIQKNQDKLTAANDKFGKRAAVSASILANNLAGIDALDASLQNAAGTAETAANKQLNTLNGRLTILRSAYEGFILSVESGDGQLASFMKTTVEVATELLSMATGTAKLGSELKGTELRVRSIALKVQKYGGIVLSIAKVYLVAVAAQKALNISIRAYQLLMKVGYLVRFARVFISLAKAKGIATAAQKMLNLSVMANPYVAMGVAIAVVIGLIYKMATAQTETQKAMEDVNRRTSELAGSQLVDLQKLFNAIRKTNEGSKERIALIAQLKEQYPGVNAQMEKELINNKNLTKSYQFLRAEILRTAKAKAIQEKIGEQANKLVEFELNLQEKGVDSQKFMTEFQKVLKETGGVGFDAISEFNKLTKSFGIDENIVGQIGLFNDALSSLESQQVVNNLQKMNEKLQVPAPEYGKEVGQQFKGNEVTKNLTTSLMKNETAISNANITNNYNTYNGNGVLLNSQQNNQPMQQNSKVDLFINNRSGTSETFVEGTGINVEKTGY